MQRSWNIEERSFRSVTLVVFTRSRNTVADREGGGSDRIQQDVWMVANARLQQHTLKYMELGFLLAELCFVRLCGALDVDPTLSALTPNC